MANNIKFTKKFTEAVYFDNTDTIPYEAVKEYYDCAHDGEEGAVCPDEGTSEYWDIVADMVQMNAEDFEMNYAHSSAKLGMCLMRNAFDSRYPEFYGSGTRVGYAVCDCDSIHNLLKGVNNCDAFKVYCNKDGLFTSGYHHDGHNKTEIRMLTKKGLAFFEKHEMTYENMEKMYNIKGYTTKVKHWLF